MIFKNREEAAYQLAEKLKEYKGRNPLILAIPRGAVPMARIISDALEGEMDVVLVHKLRAPFQPELAIGSVDETGQTFLNKNMQGIDITHSYILKEKEAQIEMLRKRRARYTPIHTPISPTNRIVVIVDDGIATGSSMIAALHVVRVKNPKKLVAATAVAPFDSLQVIRELADDTVCLEVPADFMAVGQFFEEFSQVSDDEVIAILQGKVSKSSATQ
ncbi:MAG TPA: phosphoribosyltransferase family protein [Nitrospiria bacterium]|jgi:predicted phosphoribosyltransferase